MTFKKNRFTLIDPSCLFLERSLLPPFRLLDFLRFQIESQSLFGLKLGSVIFWICYLGKSWLKWIFAVAKQLRVMIGTNSPTDKQITVPRYVSSSYLGLQWQIPSRMDKQIKRETYIDRHLFIIFLSYRDAIEKRPV